MCLFYPFSPYVFGIVMCITVALLSKNLILSPIRTIFLVTLLFKNDTSASNVLQESSIFFCDVSYIPCPFS